MPGEPSSRSRAMTGSYSARLGAAAAPGDDQVQADVAAPGQVVQQRRQRVGRAGGHQVVVVDQQEQVRALPPAAVAQLLGGDVRAGQPVAPSPRATSVDRCPAVTCAVGAVAEQVLGVDRAEQAAPVVDER